MCPILSRVTTYSKTDSRVSPCNATALRKASRRVTQLYDAALEPTGLRSTQFAILVELANWSTDPPTLAELADALAIDRSSLGHNLRPLEREGLIVLREGAEDRRRRHMAGGSASVAGGAEQVRACLRPVRGRRAACHIVGNPPSPAAWFLKGLIGTWPAAGGADTVTNLRNLCAYAFSFANMGICP